MSGHTLIQFVVKKMVKQLKLELKSINEEDGNRDLGNEVLRTPPSSPPWNAIPSGQTKEFPGR